MFRTLTLSILLAAAAASAAFAQREAPAETRGAPQSQGVAEEMAAAGLREGPATFAPLATRLSPAVVNISTAQTVTFEDGLPEFPPGSPLERFNDFLGGQSGSRIANSLGSGFVIDASGVVVTNNHVIENADEVAVNFVDGTSLPAEIVGTDPATDLAVLQVRPDEPLPYVEFGDSDAALVGDWVVAIGNPFGLGGTLTQGIISARNRNIDAGPYDDFIQTDAAINRGNSGGPLFDMDGHVIGVNTAILSPTGANVGISFSVPSNIAAPIVSQLLEFGVARRGWLGVVVQDLTRDRAEELGMARPRGAVITALTEEGPADEAGLELEDVILTFNGVEIGESRELSQIVAQTGIGETVVVDYVRDDDERTARVTVAELTSDESGGPQRTLADNEPDSVDLLGMTLGPLTAADRRRIGVAATVQGVLVLSVDEDSDAAGKVREGDVIEEIAWEPISSLSEAQERVEAAMAESAGQVQFVVNRRGALMIRSLAAN